MRSLTRQVCWSKRVQRWWKALTVSNYFLFFAFCEIWTILTGLTHLLSGMAQRSVSFAWTIRGKRSTDVAAPWFIAVTLASIYHLKVYEYWLLYIRTKQIWIGMPHSSHSTEHIGNECFKKESWVASKLRY